MSRIFGLVRSSVQATYLGTGAVADAFSLAVRFPNLLQNLLGEGVLSASFIPAYAAHVQSGDKEKGRALAGAVFTLLSLISAALVLLGMLLAPWLIEHLFARGWDADRQALATRLVRIVFPGTGLLVLSAWCLGVLNSHRRFLMSYAAPVLWNIAIIAALLLAGRRGEVAEDVAVYAATGALVGSAMQLLVQWPSVMALLGGLTLRFSAAGDELTRVVKRFVPALTSRGSVQLSAYIDMILVNRLTGVGAFAAFSYAQLLYQLPISLFGMAVSAAELPGLSAAAGGEVQRGSVQAHELQRRTGAASRRALYFVLPSALALALFGNHIVALLFLRGAFTQEDVVTTWVILCGFALGVVPATLGRLMATAFFAMHDTRTPLRFSVIRIVLSTLLAVLLMYGLPQAMSPALFEGREGLRVAGLSVAGAIGFWFEFALLFSAFERTAGPPEGRRGYATTLIACAVAAAAIALMARFALADTALDPAIRLLVGEFSSAVSNIAVIAAFGLSYLLLTAAFGVSEVAAFIRGRTGR